MANEPVEKPSGKTAKDENFPVGSWLLPARLRPHVATFYNFARAIDDIADDPDLDPREKLRRLERFEVALGDDEDKDPALETAHEMRRSLFETLVTRQHCLNLIAAFKQDTEKTRYETWNELLGYCSLSANPVGRYLLDLHRESGDLYIQSDSICSALQILNHLQDCQEDYQRLDRVYIPLEWLEGIGLSAAVLNQDRCPASLRQVFDQCIEGVEALLDKGRNLPEALTSPRLAMEVSVIVRLADRLAQLLKNGDPLACQVGLTKADFAWCGLRALGGMPIQSALAFFRAKRHSSNTPGS